MSEQAKRGKLVLFSCLFCLLLAGVPARLLRATFLALLTDLLCVCWVSFGKHTYIYMYNVRFTYLLKRC